MSDAKQRVGAAVQLEFIAHCDVLPEVLAPHVET